MADLVGALARHGYVERRRDPTNRRRLLISLTHCGRALLAKHEPEVRALEERMLGDLDRHAPAYAQYLPGIVG